MQNGDLPSQIFGEDTFGGSDYELYEEDGEFVLSVDVSGSEREEIGLTWDDGVFNVAAEHVDEDRGRKRPTTDGSASRRTSTTRRSPRRTKRRPRSRAPRDGDDDSGQDDPHRELTATGPRAVA